MTSYTAALRELVAAGVAEERWDVGLACPLWRAVPAVEIGDESRQETTSA